jgi:hypothetical protein
VDWFQTVLNEWRREGIKDDADRAKWDAQHELLLQSKRALRKVNAIRKQQVAACGRAAA